MFEDTFSKRHGYTSPPVQGERKSLSKEARTRLWNIFHSDFSRPNTQPIPYSITAEVKFSPMGNIFLRGVWTEFFGERLDRYPGYEAVIAHIANGFERGAWHFPFDIWEEIFKAHPPPIPQPEQTAEAIRKALERENTAYTFVGGLFVERMTTSEVQSIEKVLFSPIEGIRKHFITALQFLSDRKNPNYRNSVKESISAVETACKHLTGLEKATLGDALNKLHNKRSLHQAFKDALAKLYGWTSDEDGIRHSIMESDNIERADAQFMLVTCSAFVNYLFER
jgi:AbiJ N-terminal domain 4